MSKDKMDKADKAGHGTEVPHEPPAVAEAGAGGSAQDPLKALETEAAQLRERLARARADYDNLQKRVAREADAERERVKARVLDGLLPVYELAQMAAHQAGLHPSPVTEGVELMAREFSRLLEREGLVPIGKVGEPFDAKVHEALANEPAEGVPSGSVSRVVLPGYRLGEKVLRHAKVTVAP